MIKKRFRLGVDVGGTNTDAVLMAGREVVATAKSFTTEDVRGGIMSAVTSLLDRSGEDRRAIGAVMVGTTQFVNAFVQRRGLAKVAALRIALPMGDGVPPMTGWPDDLVAAIDPEIRMLGGGAFFTGKAYAPLDEDGIRAAARDARDKGCRAIAVSAVFAPMRPDLEERAEALIHDVFPEARVTLSAALGGLGLIERENATIINASLSELAGHVIRSMRDAFTEMAIEAPLWLSRNDGTLISTEMAERLPILTCSAGPTNSIRGAAFLTGLDEAIVADIGGTTTDIGFLVRGFPRETTAANDIGGVRTNFRMPDVFSIGLGGGSLVTEEAGTIRVGPRSVGYRLQQEALVFGGQTLTASDIAVRAGQAAMGDASHLSGISDVLVDGALSAIHNAIEAAVDQVKTNPKPLPLVLVGGGGILVSRDLKGVSRVLRPEHAEVANAVGAAIALASGRVDKFYDVGTMGREAALDQARREAIASAIASGAVPETVEVLDIVELPMTHMRTGSVQIRVHAAGPLAALD